MMDDAFVKCQKSQDYGSKKIAFEYNQAQPKYPDEIRKLVLSILEENRKQGTSHKFLLDVGCGSGRSTSIFADEFEKLLGIDISQSQIDLAKQKVRRNNISFEVVTNNFFPVDDAFVDVVFCGISFHYLNEMVFFAECNRVLVNGGVVACVTYSPDILKSLDGQIICDSSVSKTSKWEQIQREYADNCGADKKMTNTFYTRFADAFDLIKNPTKRHVLVKTVDRKVTVAEFMRYQSCINGYATKSYPDPTRDPLNILRARLTEVFQDAGVAFKDDTEFVATFRFFVMTIQKTKHFGIA